MQNNKLFQLGLVILTMFLGAVATAKPKALYQPDLAKEASESRILAEDVIQAGRPDPRRSYVIQMGSFQGDQVSLRGSLYQGEYDMSSPRPYFSFGYHHYFIGQNPWLGVQADLGYSSVQSRDNQLNLFSLPATLGIAMRSRLWERAQLRATAMAGLSAALLFQRGLEGANTSEVKQVPTVQLGLEWGVGKLLSPNSLVPMTAFLHWRRWIDNSPDEINFDAQALSIGLGVNL